MVKRKKSFLWSTLKSLVLLAVAGGLAWFAYAWIARERQFVVRMNAGMAALSEERFQTALEIFEQLLKGLEPGRDADKIASAGEAAARCHLALAEDPARPLAESVEHYRAAERLKPGIVDNPAIRRLLEKPAFPRSDSPK